MIHNFREMFKILLHCFRILFNAAKLLNGKPRNIIFVFFDLLDEHIEVCYTAPVLYNSLGLIGFELFQSTDIC